MTETLQDIKTRCKQLGIIDITSFTKCDYETEIQAVSDCLDYIESMREPNE